MFLDETGIITKMTRLRGRALKGEHYTAAILHGHWMTTTFTAGLRLGGLSAPMLLDGPMNGEHFLAYVEQVLVLELAPDDIVIMDNLPAHKLTGVRIAIEASGAHLLYLPPYSPPLAFHRLRRWNLGQLRPTLIQSKWPLQNSKLCFAPQKRKRAMASGKAPPRSSKTLRQPNAQTISPKQDITQLDRKMR